MPAATPPVEHLLDAVKRLSPEALAEFTTRLTEWQDSGNGGLSESYLLRQTKLRLPPADARRLRELARRSERGDLSPPERQAYGALARRAERIMASRVQALAELARHRNQPVQNVKRDIGWQDPDHGA